jgi:GH24 family phage-related lysozyme (muramidase)
MTISPAGLELVKSFEGFRARAVRLADGRWMVGYGHTRAAREGVVVDAAQAEALLRSDLRPIEAALSEWVHAPLLQNQFDALVSFAFNIGLSQFRQSEVVRALNRGAPLEAARAMQPWCMARQNGEAVVVDALVRRRAIETALFLQHPGGTPAAPTAVLAPQPAPASAHPHAIAPTDPGLSLDTPDTGGAPSDGFRRDPSPTQAPGSWLRSLLQSEEPTRAALEAERERMRSAAEGDRTGDYGSEWAGGEWARRGPQRTASVDRAEAPLVRRDAARRAELWPALMGMAGAALLGGVLGSGWTRNPSGADPLASILALLAGTVAVVATLAHVLGGRRR